MLVGAGFNGLVSVFTPSQVVGFKGSENSILSYFKLRSRVQGFKGLKSVSTPSYGVGFKGSEKSIRLYSKPSSRVQGFGE